jgi:hypothetical protein
MRSRKILLVLALAVSSVALPAAAAAAHLVAPLKDQQVIDGCSWSASAPTIGAGFVFLAELDESRIVMNIDGWDIELKLVAAQGKLEKVGDVLERTFIAGDATVKARYTVTWVCPEDSESCEVTKFAAKFTVTKGSQSEIVNATGPVGC